MQALRIANYKVIKGTFPELAEQAKGGMLDIFNATPGQDEPIREHETIAVTILSIK